MITSIMAGFAFGYCIMDIIQNYRSNKRINEIVNELTSRNNYDD